jgi:hypothetical protein
VTAWCLNGRLFIRPGEGKPGATWERTRVVGSLWEAARAGAQRRKERGREGKNRGTERRAWRSRRGAAEEQDAESSEELEEVEEGGVVGTAGQRAGAVDGVYGSHSTR